MCIFEAIQIRSFGLYHWESSCISAHFIFDAFIKTF
jgi:hypothetical protein